MRIALLGATGMLGSKAVEIFKARGHEVLTPTHAEVDLNHPYTIENFFKLNQFEALVNCAAFTRVDACEEPAKFSMVLNVNGTSVGWLAKFCKKANRTLLLFSTDYIFNGQKREPYLVEDKPDPLNTYGKTKLQGEKLILAEGPSYYLIRTSWVFGPKGQNFVKTMARLMSSKPRVEVVSDQVGGPTYTGILAQFAIELLEKKLPYGIYNFANEGTTSWYGFAKEIQKQLGLSSCYVASITSADIFRPAKRPSNSQLDLSKAISIIGHSFRPWQEALKDYLTKELPSESA